MSIMSFLSYKHLFVQSWKFTFGSYVGNWWGDPYDSSDEKWCTSLNVPIATWRARKSSFHVEDMHMWILVTSSMILLLLGTWCMMNIEERLKK